ncbi:MAG: PEPxxWA-CTERM sorting domain-containing protein [Phenylobacterium sp.]|nr:PEPxxWA-CTERM sorting domain-containing protein [Phenylobacterium sp.]
MGLKIFGSTAAALGAAVVGFAAAPAAAAVTLNINPGYESTENTGASANATFSFVDVGGDVKVSILLENTTDGTAGDGATLATLVAIAFDLPTLASPLTSGDLDANGSTFTKFWTSPDFQPFTTPGGGSLAFDYGISNPRPTFNGGPAGTGVTAGNSIEIFLLADTNLNAAQFEAAFLTGYQTGDFVIGARFQQVGTPGDNGGSDKVLGGITTTVVPEPTTWALMIMGFGAAGAMLRRRRTVFG